MLRGAEAFKGSKVQGCTLRNNKYKVRGDKNSTSRGAMYEVKTKPISISVAGKSLFRFLRYNHQLYLFPSALTSNLKPPTSAERVNCSCLYRPSTSYFFLTCASVIGRMNQITSEEFMKTRLISLCLFLLTVVLLLSCGNVAPIPDPIEILVSRSQAYFERDGMMYVVNCFYAPEIWKIEKGASKAELLTENPPAAANMKDWFQFFDAQVVVGQNIIFHNKAYPGNVIRLNLSSGKWDILSEGNGFYIAKSQTKLYSFFIGEFEERIIRISFEEKNGNVNFVRSEAGKWDKDDGKFRFDDLPWEDIKLLGEGLAQTMSELKERVQLPDISTIPNYGRTVCSGGEYYIFGTAPLTIISMKDGKNGYYSDPSGQIRIPIDITPLPSESALLLRYYPGFDNEVVSEIKIKLSEFKPIP